MATAAVASAERKFEFIQELIKKLKELVGPEEAKRLLEWMSKSGLRIVVAGKTGVGKSTLLNTFLGFDAFTEGDSFGAVTTHVKEYKHMMNGVKITVWDCPGLQDNSGNEDQYLEELKTKTNGDIHLMLYCSNMLEPRSDLHSGTAVDRITSILGKDIWKKTALMLTFANVYEMRLIKDQCMTSEAALKEFNEKTKEWQNKLQEKLQSIDGIERSTIDELKVLPAGKDGHIPLFGNKDWLSELWAEIVTRVEDEAQKAVFMLSADRIHKPGEVTEKDKADPLRPPIILTSKVKKILGATTIGIITTGAGIGASIGVGVGGFAMGIPSLGIGAGVGGVLGAAAGAAIGTGIGAIAAAIVMLYKRRKRREGYEELK